MTAKLDYQLLESIATVDDLALIMLVAVLIPGVGVEVNGARRWVQLPGTRFQPSEFAKIALIIALAHYCERKGGKMDTFKYGMLVPGLGMGLFLGLIFLEPDWGAPRCWRWCAG